VINLIGRREEKEERIALPKGAAELINCKHKLASLWIPHLYFLSLSLSSLSLFKTGGTDGEKCELSIRTTKTVEKSTILSEKCCSRPMGHYGQNMARKIDMLLSYGPFLCLLMFKML